METFLQDILSFLLLYKYAALFIITFLAAFALPLPSTTSLMTAAGFASQGYLHIGWVIFFAILGNVVADNLIYWIIRIFGQPLLHHFGFQKTLESPLLTSLSEKLSRHENSVIFFSRFEVIATITVNFLMGFAQTDYKKFFLYGLAGEATQVIMFAGIGYFFGNNWESIIALFGQFTFVFILFVFFFLLIFRKRFVYYLLKK